MAAISSETRIPLEIIDRIRGMIGKVVSTVFVGDGKRLCIGFGQVTKSGTVAHGEWEFGTYDCSWRVSQDGRLACASNDAIDSLSELTNKISACELGGFVGIEQITECDTRFVFAKGFIDILCTISDDDEILHLFFPTNEVVTFSPSEGWVLGKSDRPWST